MKTLLLSNTSWSVLYDAKKHKLLITDDQRTLSLPQVFPPTCLCWSPNGQYLALAHHKGIDLVEVAAGRKYSLPACPQRFPGDRILSLCFSPQNMHLAVGKADGELAVLWIDGTLCWKQCLSASAITNLAWEPCGKRVASSNLDGLVVHWDASTGTVVEAWDSPLVVSQLVWTHSTFLVMHQGRNVQILSLSESLSSSSESRCGTTQ